MSAGATEALQHEYQCAPVRQSVRMWDGDVSVLGWGQAGAAGPAIHFAHANGFNALAYRTMLDGLGLHMRVQASDLRGHGQTTLAANPRGLKSWQVHADDIIRLVRETEGRPRLLAGHSIGATASLMAALDHPQWVTGLLLVEPVLLAPAELRRIAIRTFLGLHRPPSLTRRKRGIFASREAMLQFYRSRGAFRRWPEQVVRDFVEGGSLDYLDFRQVRLACTPGWEEANYVAGPPNLWPQLRQLQVPLTILLAEQRSTCSDEATALLEQRLPDARIIRVPGTTHFLPFERPDLVISEARLLARLSEGYARHDERFEKSPGLRGDVHGLALDKIQ